MHCYLLKQNALLFSFLLVLKKKVSPMRILSDFLSTLSYKKNSQKSCFVRCLPHENFWKLTGMTLLKLKSSLKCSEWGHLNFMGSIGDHWPVYFIIRSAIKDFSRVPTGSEKPIHVIRPDIVGTYRYWAPKYKSRPTDRNSWYIWILIFRFCQKLKLVFRSPQTLPLSKFTTGSGNRTLLVFRNR